MPQRFLKPGLTSSPKWDACSWKAQSFYVRLITLVDDFGRYEADYRLLRSHAFPMRDDVSVKAVEELCSELHENKLVTFYTADGKRFLQIEKWTERARSDKSKFPDPPLRNPAESCGILPSSSSSSPASSPPTIVIAHSPPELPLGESAEVDMPCEVTIWNKAGLPEVKSFNADRKKRLKARKGEPYFVANFAQAVEKIKASSFCMGGGPSGWKADFDWILQPGTIAKVMEGKYDDRTPQRTESNEIQEQIEVRNLL